LSGGKGGRNGLETELRRLNIVQKNSRPNHPTTCGKVERFQQTMKKWLRAQPVQPTTIAELQALLDTFVEYYNRHRPHRSLPHRCTPATAYHARPKATPTGDRTGDIHHRVRTDRVDDTGAVSLRRAGRLHHIGLGRTHARTRVLLLVQDLQITIINAATGELLRELVLDPTRTTNPADSHPDHPNAHRQPHPGRHPDPGRQRRPQPGSRLAAGHPQGPGLDPGENGATITSRDAETPRQHKIKMRRCPETPANGVPRHHICSGDRI
jgi:hypothetical protein